MSIENRPYAGTWALNRRPVVKHTPDLLVYINGDLTITGCPRCRGRVEIQKYVTGVSVEAGTDPGSHSASINMSLPKVSGEQLFSDGKHKLPPGLEIHIFMRGYFPVQGQFKHLPDPNLEFRTPTASGEREKLNLSNYASYPYYPVFHGVVVNSDFNYSDGIFTGSISCQSLLHFWQFHNMATSGSHFGNRPNNSGIKPNFYGHIFNNMHPFGIIYTLYRDIAGAAAGVEFALDEESNIDAVSASSTSEGKQLWDQVTLYWEQRFKTRIQNLRMYGANGQLFNSVQQAFLGSASNRDLQQLIPTGQFNDPETGRSTIDPTSRNYSVAKALGLTGQAGIDQTFAPAVTQNGETFKVNLLDMFAFTQAIGEVGSVNKWETTYETKLSIAQAVTEVTGYEFFQDVDGDLVFKPPFYNMDTSSNRIYRIEDIDQISFSAQEKEPEATYINVRGTWFEGLTDVVANTGATGKRALYIDYALVAKFGWRPANIDITYTADPRVLFYIGMARLDLLNIDVNSATCAIPLRPELRPGYPVYITSEDCFYYVTQLSHSFQFAGQCTTNLTLTCRRARFDAPGFNDDAPPGKTAIDLIRLDRPDLSPRPLEVIENGIPRFQGFPNVVLALDPTKANPQFFSVGAGIDYINSTDDVRLFFNFIRQDIAALTPQVLQVAPEFVDENGNIRAQISNEELRYRLVTGPKPEDFIEFNLADLITSFSSIEQARQRLQTLESLIQEKRNELTIATLEENNPISGATASRGRVQEELLRLEARFTDEEQNLAQAAEGDTNDRNILIQLLESLTKFRGSPGRKRVAGIPGSDVTAAYFDSLISLKAQYMANQLPGYYRYYSCSHPDPSQQGQPIIQFDDGTKPPPSPPIQEVIQTAPQDTVLPPFVEGDSLPSEPGARLQAKLDLIGVDWVGTRIVPRSQFPGDSRKGSQSIFGYRGANAQNLTEEISNNLANIIDAANNIRNRLLSNPDFQALGFSIGAGSSWRPDPEGKTSEAMHSLGRAVDLGLRPTLFDSVEDGRLDEFKQAFELFKVEVMRAYQNREVNFVQVYENRGGRKGDFIHIDQRTRDDVASIAAKRGIPYPPSGADRKKVPGVYGFGIVDPTIDSAKAERNRLADEAGFPGYGLNRPRRKQRDIPPKTFPLKDQIPQRPPAPRPAPPPVQVQTNPEVLQAEPNIKLREINLQTPREVVGFIPPTRIDPDFRAPEAQLGTIQCTKGFNVAQGPGKGTIVLATDQIQTLSFVRFGSSKATAIIGSSVNSGLISFNRVAFQTRLNARFIEAAGGVDDPSLTPTDIFKPLYDQIAAEVVAINIPVWIDGNQVGSENLTLPDFSDAVPGVAITPSLESQFSGTSIPIDTTSLQLLQVVPGYKAPPARTVDSQVYEPTIRKLSAAYAKSITDSIDGAFTTSQRRALDPKTARAARLNSIQTAYEQIVEICIGNEPSSYFEKERQIIKTGQSGKIDKPIFAPVKPVSDERGYEHFGAYRYGRGLTIEPGGTFEFLHSNSDPFQNISADAAELFLQALTSVKTGIRNNQLSAIRESLVQTVQETINSVEDFALGEEQGPELPPSLAQQTTGTADNAALRQAIAELRRTPRGQEALREILEANGDDPNLISQDDWNVENTQFQQNFSNFAANYTKTGVFKTTVANAAYQLSDLTTHILDRVNATCRCKGTSADVRLEAFGRRAFAGIDVVDGLENPAFAFVQEGINSISADFIRHQKVLRGEVLDLSQLPSQQIFDSIWNDAGKLLGALGQFV